MESQRASFLIFTAKENRFGLSQGTQLMLPISIFIGLSWLMDEYYPLLKYIFRFLGIINCIVLLFFMFFRFFQTEKLNGILKGKLVFYQDKIEIDNRIIQVTEIKKLEIHYGDFHGRRTNWITDFDPNISQGVDNKLCLNLKTNEEINVRFQQQYEAEFINLCKPFFVGYYHSKVISFLRLIELLKIDKYEEIQLFKEELNRLEKN